MGVQLVRHLGDLLVQPLDGGVDLEVEFLLLDLPLGPALLQLPPLRLQVLDLEQDLQLCVHGRSPLDRLLLEQRQELLGVSSCVSRSGTSGSLANWAILPSTGRYWLLTSSGGATMRKKSAPAGRRWP
jgi:hypothetical protein